MQGPCGEARRLSVRQEDMGAAAVCVYRKELALVNVRVAEILLQEGFIMLSGE